MNVREEYRIKQESVRFIGCKPDVNKNTLNLCSQRDASERASKDNSNERCASFSRDCLCVFESDDVENIRYVCECVCVCVFKNRIHEKEERTLLIIWVGICLTKREARGRYWQR